jgi:hypothetical protein
MAVLAGPRGSAVRVETRGGLADVSHIKMQVPLPETADELCAVTQDVKAASDRGIGVEIQGVSSVPTWSGASSSRRARFPPLATLVPAHHAITIRVDLTSMVVDSTRIETRCSSPLGAFLLLKGFHERYPSV